MPQPPSNPHDIHRWKIWEKVLLCGVVLFALLLIAVAALGLSGRFSVLDKESAANKSQVEGSPDVVVNTYRCDQSPYEWRVVERDAFRAATFENNRSSVYSYRVPVLMRGEQVVYEGSERDNGVANSNFPVAEPFLKAYIVSRAVFNTGDPEGRYWNDKYYREIALSSPAVSMQDFTNIARCTEKHRAMIDKDLVMDNYPRSIGWLVLRGTPERTKVMGNIAYICDSGSTGIIAGGRHIFYYPAGTDFNAGYVSNSTEGGWITLDGKVHPRQVYSPLQSGGVEPESVIPHCVDSTGQSIVDVVRSIPSRIEYLE